MRRTRIAALTAAAALAAAGTGVAVATSRDDDAKQREQAVLSDAAKRLDVSPSELRDALSQAQDAQLDADVKAGRLTQEQADEIKRHRDEAGTVLGRPRRVPPSRHGPAYRALRTRGPGTGPATSSTRPRTRSASRQAKLFEQLRDGKSLAEIAKAERQVDATTSKPPCAGRVKAELDEAVEERPADPRAGRRDARPPVDAPGRHRQVGGRERGFRSPGPVGPRPARRAAAREPCTTPCSPSGPPRTVRRCCARSRTRSSAAG